MQRIKTCNRSDPLMVSSRIDGFHSSTHPTTHCSFVGWVERSETHRRAGQGGSERLPRIEAAQETGVEIQRFPAACPWMADQILGEGWLPE